MARKQSPKHSILLWWHENKGYLPFKYNGHKISTIKPVNDSDDIFESRIIPFDVIQQEWIPAFKRDGWVVKVDKQAKHVAVLCPMHRNLSVNALAWLIGDLA